MDDDNDWTKQLPKETLERILRGPRHTKDCSLVTTHHLTCTCGAYRRPPFTDAQATNTSSTNWQPR